MAMAIYGFGTIEYDRHGQSFMLLNNSGVIYIVNLILKRPF